MSNVNEAIKSFIAKNPDRKVEEAYEHKELYLFIAPDKNAKGADYSDPFFIVDKKTGQFQQFTPAANPKEYQKLINPKTKVYPVSEE